MMMEVVRDGDFVMMVMNIIAFIDIIKNVMKIMVFVLFSLVKGCWRTRKRLL